MTISKSVLAAFGVLTMGLVLTVPMHGAEVEHRTNYLTFSGPVALRCHPPGGHLHRRAVVDTEADIIVVRDRNRSKVYFMAFTQRTERPAAMKLSAVVTLLRHDRERQRRSPHGINSAREAVTASSIARMRWRSHRRGRLSPAPQSAAGYRFRYPVSGVRYGPVRERARGPAGGKTSASCPQSFSPPVAGRDEAAQKNGCVLCPFARRSRSTVRLAWCTASAVER